MVRTIGWISLILLVSPTRASEPVFPKDCGIIDVTLAPYFAKGDGKSDATRAIQKALDDHPNEGAIIYLPKGIYRISDTLRWPKGAWGGMEEKNTILQGEGRELTRLQLPDKCPGFTDAQKPKALAWTGKAPAQRFRNAVRNLTIDTGVGNAGAIGLQFMANNQGTVSDLTIRSGDAGGPIGLDLGYTDENGPCLIKNVHVRGFAVGIRAAAAVDSITCENISLEGQSLFGLVNEGQILNIRNFQSKNRVPAIKNAKGTSFLTLIEAEFTGTEGASKTAAIENEAPLFVRQAKATGYSQILQSIGGEKCDGLAIDEYSYLPVAKLFPSGNRSLGLPIEETPDLPQDDPKTWANVRKYGAGGNDYNNREKNDDTLAFQKAIDSGASTVLVPRGFYVFNDTIHIRGKVRRILFMESQLVAGLGFKGKDKPVFKFDAQTATTVLLDRFNCTFGSHEKVWLEHAAPKGTLVIQNSIMGRYESVGGGRVFFEDVCGGPFFFRKQDVWARQLNQESEGTHVLNEGGRLWILGYKTERGGTLLETTQGGKTEVLGCFVYPTTGESKQPMFVVADSSFSATMGEAHFGGSFPILVRETRKGEVRDLKRKDAPSRYGIGALLPLFVTDQSMDKR